MSISKSRACFLCKFYSTAWHLNHIFSYEAGINTFDTANVSVINLNTVEILTPFPNQSYSNGLSEIILGKAIKQLNLPREEIVVMTKVSRS